MKIDLYNQLGEIVGKVNLPDSVFGVEVDANLIHQAIVAQMANSRRTLAHTKSRSEVRGGGIKPWRQKGTGRARHGSSRSPIWVGGGVTFGPTKNRNFTKKINKKAKRKALSMTLSSKLEDKQFLVVDDIKLKESKTKEAVSIIGNLTKHLEGYKQSKDKQDTIFLAYSQVKSLCFGF